MIDSGELLLAAVRRLAAAAPEQVAYLAELGVSPSADELALELHEAMTSAPAVAGPARAALATLDAALDAMSGADHAALWHQDALATAPEWSVVRGLAREAKELLEASETLR